jgi:hypothetical protein
MNQWPDDRLNERFALIEQRFSREEDFRQRVRNRLQEIDRGMFELASGVQEARQAAARAETDSDDTKRLLFTLAISLLTATLGLCAALIGVMVL